MKTWLVKISQGGFEYIGEIEVHADKLEWDWSSENKREEWAELIVPPKFKEERGEVPVGNMLIIDGAKIVFDEPFLAPIEIDLCRLA